jgi:small subunit ribosomal protein S9
MANKLSKKSTTKIQKIVKKTKPEVVAKSGKAPVVSAFVAPKVPYTEGIGRRKVATARVRIYKTPGDFIVNDMAAGAYFTGITSASEVYNQPFALTNTKHEFTVSCKVSGSGIAAQLDAVVHGITRALIKYDPSFKGVLKAQGLVTRDDRMKETRKIGMGGKARRQRQSPKR